LPKSKEDLFYAQDQLDPENQPLWQLLLITSYKHNADTF